MPSLRSWIVEQVLWLTGSKAKMKDAASFDNSIPAGRSQTSRPPWFLDSSVGVSELDDTPCLTFSLAPKAGTKHNLTVIFFHGGCYTYEEQKYHWHFAASLCMRLNCTVLLPIYPLAPESTADRTVSLAHALYTQVAERAQKDGRKNGGTAGKVVLLGDSAGGGLALAVAQQLLLAGSEGSHARAATVMNPAAVVLIAPWLDVQLTNPGIAAVAPLDPMLDVPGLKHAGKLYAGKLPVTDPRVSPGFGPVKGLPPLSVFVGTHDLLLPDCRAFRDRCATESVQLRYVEAEGMVHDYPLIYHMPEGLQAAEEIAAAIEKDAGL